jgi:hypothetical protein
VANSSERLRVKVRRMKEELGEGELIRNPGKQEEDG